MNEYLFWGAYPQTWFFKSLLRLIKASVLRYFSGATQSNPGEVSSHTATKRLADILLPQDHRSKPAEKSTDMKSLQHFRF